MLADPVIVQREIKLGEVACSNPCKAFRMRVMLKKARMNNNGEIPKAFVVPFAVPSCYCFVEVLRF